MANFYDNYVNFPSTDDHVKQKCMDLLKIMVSMRWYMGWFPCVGTWDGFHALVHGMVSMRWCMGWFPCVGAWDGFHALVHGMVSMFM